MAGWDRETSRAGLQGQKNQRGGVSSFWPSQQSQKPLKNYHRTPSCCVKAGVASNSPRDVTGWTDEEIRKWFLFSSRNTLAEFPQQVSTSAFGENGSVLVIWQKNKEKKKLPGLLGVTSTISIIEEPGLEIWCYHIRLWDLRRLLSPNPA